MSRKNNDNTVFRTATILFVDLVGSSDAASFMDSSEYGKHLSGFKDIIEKTWLELFGQKKTKAEDGVYTKQIQGDQGFFLFVNAWEKEDDSRSKSGAIEKDIIEILKLALAIKYRWQLTQKNIGQIKNNKKPFEIAIGINTGTVSIKKVNKGKGDNGLKYETEGYAINLAKRIEGESRKGTYSKIFVGETTYGLYSDSPGENPIRFKRRELAPLKGIAGDIRIYEIAYATIEDDEENAILVIPNDCKELNRKNREALKATKRYFLATQDPWLANVYCNVKWAQIQNKIESKKQIYDPDFQDIIEMARKLVEFDNGFSAWKVYLGQMVLDYFKYSLKKKRGKVKKNNVLLRDTIDILKALTSSEPYELDARLTLGRFYLEATGLSERIHNELIELKKAAKDLAIEQFKRILVWDAEHEEAHYYCAAALIASDPRKKPELDQDDTDFKKEASSHLDDLLKLCEKRYTLEAIKKMLKNALDDPLFKPLTDELEKRLNGINKKLGK